MSKLPSGTYRLLLIHEASNTTAWERGAIPAATVEQIAALLAEVTPFVMAARGAHQAYAGVRQALDGITAMRPAKRARGKR